MIGWRGAETGLEDVSGPSMWGERCQNGRGEKLLHVIGAGRGTFWRCYATPRKRKRSVTGLGGEGRYRKWSSRIR